MATISKRRWANKSGTHEAWVLSYVDTQGKRHREQFSRKRDADARRVEVEGQIGNGTFRPDAATTTIRKACEDYEKHLQARMEREERVTPLYFANVSAHLWNYIAPKERAATEKARPGGARQRVQFDHGVGELKLSQFTARGVGELRDRIREAGSSVTTTRQILGTLSRVLQHAVANDLIAVNVAKGIKVVGKRNERAKKIVAPSVAEVATFISVADTDFQVKIKFAAASGLRASELHALRWRHVDLKGGEVRVETRVDANRNEDTTKSVAGLRTIPLGSGIVTMLKEWKLRTAFKKDDDLVFPNTKGGFESHHNMVKRRIRPLMLKATSKAKGEGRRFKPFGWHALRHFAISSWIDAGFQPKTIQTFAGHSSLAVTMDRYGHMFPKDDHRETMDKIAASVFLDGA